ncbi:MAG: GAF domain-containing protein [Proteobacteria bacterium]|nr:GAF domain-containing protein [Pseudomonadota bacterium]
MDTPRRLLSRLRELMARGPAPLPELVRVVSAELVADVCSVYAMQPGEILELAATQGLRPDAVGRTRLRVGEGIVGLCAASAEVLNLPDAQNHPAFAYRPETGEEPYASLLAVPVRRAGRTLGVLAVQSRDPRLYADDEVEVLETVAMLLAEVLPALGALGGSAEGVGGMVPRTFAGTPLVGGIAVGPIVLRRARLGARRMLAEDVAAEQARLDEAAARMQREIDALVSARLPGDEHGADAAASREVLAAYRLVAADTGWLTRVAEVIRGGLSAEAAVQRVMNDLRDRMRRFADPYLRERLADLEDVANGLLRALEGEAAMPVDARGAILLARRLGPAELLDWHARGIAGLIVEEASPSGHAAILARALGLPALGGVRGLLDAAEPGDEVVLDADEKHAILRPLADVRQVYRHALEARAAREAGFAALRDRPSETADGTPMTLMLNVGLRLELDQLDRTGAAGIGLFRTEIAMLARGSVADVAEQAAIYASVLDAAAGRPVLFRTLDLGSDKMLPGEAPPEEENPAMGWRSLRVALDRPILLRRQLRALLLAAGGRDLSVMFPMVATVAEFRAARDLLRAEAKRVRPAPARIAVGAMLEVPALLWQLPELLRETDFVSVGSNDLMQFAFAADRGTPALAARYDLLSAPALDMLEHIVREADAAGVSLSLCGEAASRPLEAMALAGIGFRSLSMTAPGIMPVKAMLAALDLRAFRPVLASIRRGGAGDASLREALSTWAREAGLPV